MIITDKFVFIHQPKTGGTFVTSNLIELYGLKGELNVDFPDLKSEKGEKYEFNNIDNLGDFLVIGKKHATCDEIPRNLLKSRIILGTVRSPLEKYVSNYVFGWWKRTEFLSYYQGVSDFDKRFGNFPDLSFEQFIEIEYEAFGLEKLPVFWESDSIGLSTIQFINFYIRNSKEYLENYQEIVFSKEFIATHLYPVHFIRTENLNQDLYGFLISLGISSEKLNFILNKDKVLPLGKGRTKEQKWQKYYTPELLETVLRKDKLIFDLFPEFIPKSL